MQWCQIASGGEDGRISLMRLDNWNADVSLRKNAFTKCFFICMKTERIIIYVGTGTSVHQVLYLSEAELAAACAGSEVQCWDLRANTQAQQLQEYVA